MGFWSSIKSAVKNHRKELKWFWKYAILSKLHFWKYKSKKVIMFRLDLIGDCTMFTSTAKAVREMYKDREFTIVCLSISKPIFERLGVFDRIITVDFRPENIDYAKLKKTIKLLRKEKYDIFLQPQISKFPVADILAAALKVNERIAIEPLFAGIGGNSGKRWIKMSNFIYNKLIPYPRGNVSEFDYYGAFVRGLGNKEFKTTPPRLSYKQQHFIEGKYYVLYPGGSLAWKFWPPECFARVVDYIYRRTGLIGVILGTTGEQWVSDKLKDNISLQTSMSMIDLTGRTSIYDVIDIIGNAELVISNDTSGVHIACATQTPSIAIAGGWLFNRFLPYSIECVKDSECLPYVAFNHMECFNCGWNRDVMRNNNIKCLENMDKGLQCVCISSISEKQVIGLVDKILEQITDN